MSNASKIKKISVALLTFFIVASILVGFVSGFIATFVYLSPYGGEFAVGELSIHFLELGNGNSGDSIYIKAGDTDILIDAGSKKNSAATICEYVDNFCEDGVLEYVIATHAHEDHIAGFVGMATISGIFDYYKCETIIDFPKTNATTTIYKDYTDKRDNEVEEGASHYTALQCYNNQDGAKRIYDLGQGIEMIFLYNYYYENNTSNENEYSVCLMIKHGNKYFLFTGDLEGGGESKLVEYNELPQMELFKAAHHGSYTANTKVLLDVIKPKIVCVCCSAGAMEGRNTAKENTFPSQKFIDNIAEYTDRIYVPTFCIVEYSEEKGKDVDVGFNLLNGNIVVYSDAGAVTVEGSNNTTKLKDTVWFSGNRTRPSAWAN